MMRPSLPYQGIGRRASGTDGGAKPAYDMEIEILPVDEPRDLKLGWTVHEEIGEATFSIPGWLYDGIRPLNKDSARNLLAWHGIYQLDGGWAIIKLQSELVPAWPLESRVCMEPLPMRDQPDKGRVIKWSPTREPLEQEFVQAQEIIDRDMYAAKISPEQLEQLRQWIKE